MSKNISLSSAKAFPSSTPFNSRFGGLRPSFLKNRAHMWRFDEEKALLLTTPEHSKKHRCWDSLTPPASSSQSQQDSRKLLPSAKVAAAVCEEEGLSPYRSVEDQISSVDVSLGRLTVSPHASFAFPQTHMQLLVKYTYPAVRGDVDVNGYGKGDADVRDDDTNVMTAGEAIKESIVPFSQKAIRRFVRAQSQRAEERERHLKEKEENEKKKEAEKEVQQAAIDSMMPQQINKKTTSNKKSAVAQPLLPSEALQCLEDDPAHCVLLSKRINAWSLYAKARSLYAEDSCGGSSSGDVGKNDGDNNGNSVGDGRGDVPKREAASSSLAIVMPTDCKVLPAAEGIAAQLPHRFVWLPIAASWEEAGPLAPDSPFRSTLHSQKPWPFASEAPPKRKAEGERECQQVNVEGSNENGRESVRFDADHRRHVTSSGTCLPQQVVQLRALVPIVDPVIDCSLEAEVFEGESANPITSSIYSIIFSDSARMSIGALPTCSTRSRPQQSQDLSSLSDDASAGLDVPPLPSVAFVRARVRDLVVMPLLLSAAKRVAKSYSLTNRSIEEGKQKVHDDDCEFLRENKMLERSILKVICNRGQCDPPNSGSAGGDPLVARLYIDKRKLMHALGWGHCARWLGGVEMVVDGNCVRFV